MTTPGYWRVELSVLAFDDEESARHFSEHLCSAFEDLPGADERTATCGIRFVSGVDQERSGLPGSFLVGAGSGVLTMALIWAVWAVLP